MSDPAQPQQPAPKQSGIFRTGMRFGSIGCVGCLTFVVLAILALIIIGALLNSGK